MDLLIALYFRVMKVDPQNPRWPQRDRFILSKGHSSIGLYTVLALRGFLPIEELKTFDKGNSRLQGHPDVTKLPGLDTPLVPLAKDCRSDSAWRSGRGYEVKGFTRLS
jgi:transketolase